jgi:hypothetical protein
VRIKTRQVDFVIEQMVQRMPGVLAKRADHSTVVETTAASDLGVMSPNVRRFAGIQIVAFFVGLALVVIFGWRAA